MVAEKNHDTNFAKGKVISKCKNDKPSENLRRPAPAPYFHLLSLIVQIPPSGGGNQNLLSPL